ncbi:hypothetical protein H0H92_004249 [Tricholoma furcatifolium]|nr:hypothetical protein H0H92_004249 [Tricholoma furcatifolium]
MSAAISNSPGLHELFYGDSHLDDELEVDVEYLDAQRRTAEVKQGKYRLPSIYVDAFEKMVNVVYEGESHLFTEKELALLDAYSKLSYNARYCLVRLILRKTNVYHTVKSMEKFKNEVGEDGLDSAISELCKDISYNTEVKQELGDDTVPEVDIIDLTFDSDDEEETKPDLSSANSGPSRFNDQDVKPSLDTLFPPPDATPYEPDFSFFLEDETSMTLNDVLRRLNMDQLRDLVKDTRLKPEKMNKDTMIYALLLYANTQKPLSFGLKTKGKGKKTVNDGLKQTLLPFTKHQTQESRLLQMALAKLGKSVRVNVDLYWLVARLNVIYDRSTEYPKYLLVPSLLSSFKKRTYAEYKFTRDSTIWSSREEFMNYFEALRMEFAIETELEPSQSGLSATKTPGPLTKRKSEFVTPAPPGGGRLLATLLRTPKSASRTVGTPSTCKKEEEGDHHDGFAEDFEEPPNPKVQAAQKVKEVFDNHLFERWKVLVALRGEEGAKCRAPGLERFEPGFVYTRIFGKVVRAFGTLKLYKEESIVLETLLAQRYWRQGKRARWYERLALLRMNYLCRSPDPDERQKDFAILHQAMEGIVTALHDVDTHLVLRPSLIRRLMRLEKQLKIPEEDRCTLSGELRTAETIEFSAERITKTDKSLKLDAQGRPINDTVTGLRTYFSPNPKVANALANGTTSTDTVDEKGLLAKVLQGRRWKGKSLWRGRNGEEVNVECRALQYYETLGFKGFHSETRILTTLFSLLFWDIIFADVPGAFETAYQTAPLDLMEDSFYRARKDLIDTRLEEIRQGRSQEIVKRHDDLYRPKSTWCVGVRWDICTQEDLLEILKLFCEDYGGRSSGVPDLIVWDNEKGICKFVEVKGPGDTPQENQKLWFHSLLSAGANVEICKVLDKDQPPKSSKKKSTTRKAKRKRQEDVISEPEIDFDSLDHDDALDNEPYESPHNLRKRQRLSDENADVLASIPHPTPPASSPSGSATRRHNCVEVVIPPSPYRKRKVIHTPS